ncbi:MAG TPA: hypothetical protein DEQ30_03005 [Porphyromonadaceae bacterium]|nr:hypothetical protein [Porphyromonadaceae bacterium]
MPDLNLKKIQSSYNGQTPSTGKEVEDAFNRNFETVEKAISKYDVLDLNMFSGSGYINKSTGLVTSGSSYVNTGFIPVVGATNIVLTGFDGANGGAQALCAFYNKFKTFISVYTTGTSGDTTVTIPAGSFPADAYYIRCTARAAQQARSVKISFTSIIQAITDSAAAFSSTFYNVTQNNPLPSGQYYNFDTARLAIPSDLRQSGLVITYAESAKKWITMQFHGTTITEYAGNFAWYQIPDIRLTGQCMFIHQGYSNRFTGEFVNDTTCVRTAPIPLAGLPSFSFIGTNGAAGTLPSGACNFFDKDMNFLRTYTTSEIGSLSRTVLRANFPDNAAFAIVSALKTDRCQTDFVLGNFGESIAGILKLIKELDASVNNSLSEIAEALNMLDTALRTAINAVATDLEATKQDLTETKLDLSETKYDLQTTKQAVLAMSQKLDNVDETATDAYNLANQANESTIDNATEINEIKETVETLKDEKVDNGYWEDGFLYLTSNGIVVSDPIEIQGGGGGVGGGSVLRLINQGASSIGIAKGETVILRYSFSSVDAETGDPTGDGTVSYFVNSSRVYTQNVSQGNVLFDITSYLTDGINTVRVQVVDSYGAQRSLNIRVTVISLRLTSTFDDSLIYSNIIDFPYTPVGTGEKVIHIVLDGVELPTVTTTASNRQLTYRLPNLSHGAHSLQAYAKMIVEGVELTSNILNFSILYVVSGNTNVIISSSFNQTEATQYDLLLIPFSVYDPVNSATNVQLKANDIIISELVVDRTQQRWSYRIETYGTLRLEIIAGSQSKVFNLNVEKSAIDSEAETEGLELWLTSNGRSNSEANPAVWKYNTIESVLTGFNWKTNGWVLDKDSVTVLRISAGAKVEVPFKPFQNDFKPTGKTLEFEFSVNSVEDFTVPVISCWSGNRGFTITAQQITFASELSSVSAKYKDEEIIRLSIVIQNRYDKRLIFTYINGIASGVQQYALTDDFSQPSPVGITLGHEKCIVDVYNIRSYATELNAYQILNNYIADTALVSKKLDLYNRNQIYDSSGEIVYNRLLAQLPCLTIIGDLPTFKGDKKTVRTVFENVQDPDKSFTSENVQIDVQGTSSQFYPRKNFKTKHNGGFDMTESGEHLSEYILAGNNLPAKVFCEKADFAESSGTHNTGLAKFVNYLLVNFGVKTPPQKSNDGIRTTVDGYPIALFHKQTESSQMEFVGKYNFNHDKDAQEVFGLTGTAECWEFLNNTSDLCLFKSADFSAAWGDDLEARYPDGYEDNSNIKKLWEWVVGCVGNPVKFKAEFENHFNKQNIISYWILTELFGMVDQRAKNMFVTSWGNEGTGEYKWYFIFYDNDTCNGINNEGANVFGYNIETQDMIGSGHVWNGWDSELWKLVEACYPDDIMQMYKDMRTSGLLTYDKVSQVLNLEQCEKWCEVVYNMDGQYKYIQPLVDEDNASYLYALQGSRLEHRKWWLKNRFFYIDSKYNTGDFLNDFISMRLYTPTIWEGVLPNADFALTLFKDSYVRVRYGSYVIGQRAKTGDVVNITAPAIQFNDTETVVYGVSSIQSLGNLAGKYPGTVDVSNAKKLTELIIGSAVTGYKNENLTHIAIGSNIMLRKVDIQNCPNLTEPLDVSRCDNIQEIYAKGSSISMAVLPEAGLLSVLQLPTMITNLTLKNQPYLTDASLQLDGTDNITTLVLEGMNNIDQMTLIKSLLGKNPRKLNRVRLIDIDVTDYDLSVFVSLKSLQGLDENGTAVERAVVTGKVTVTTAFQTEVDDIRNAFPELEVTVGSVQEDPVTTFIFKSSESGIELMNTTFECNRSYTQINDFTFTVKAPTNTDITFTFTAEDHIDIKGSYRVTDTREQVYTAIKIPFRIITFTNTSNTPLVGVVAVINGIAYTSDSEGKILIKGEKQLIGSAVMADYGNVLINVPASVTSQTYTVMIYPYVNVTFYGQEGIMQTFVPDVYVEINGQTIKTDTFGFATIKLSKGIYTVKARYNNAIVYENNYFGVDAYNIILKIAVTVPLDDLYPAEDGSIQLYAYAAQGTQTKSIAIISTDTNYSIDWGDGNITPATGIDQQIYSHDYSAKPFGAVLIRITNPDNITYCSYPSGLFGFMSIGTSKIDCTQTKFTNQTNLRIVGKNIFKVAREQGNAVSMVSCFQACTSLLSLPAGIFDGMDIRDATALLYNVPLQSIPAGLLKDATNLTNLASAFYGLRVEEYPDDTFPDTSNVTSFSNTFRNNTNLKKMPSLRGMNAATTLENMFQNCPNIETVPYGYFYTAVNIGRADNLFYGCTKLVVSDPEMLKNSMLLYRIPYGLYQTATTNAEVIRMLENKPALNLFECFMTGTLIENVLAEYLENIQTTGWSSVTSRGFIGNCPNLKTAVIPENFQFIGTYTFYNLPSCEWIEFKATTPPSADATIISQDIPVVYVPDMAVNAYKAATGFSGYVAAGGTIKGVSERV